VARITFPECMITYHRCFEITDPSLFWELLEGYLCRCPCFLIGS